MTVTWEELAGTTGGASFSDVSGVGTGAKTIASAGGIALKNGLCDVELVPGQGTKVIKVTVVGCQGT
jgi:hypothetical protein